MGHVAWAQEGGVWAAELRLGCPGMAHRWTGRPLSLLLCQGHPFHRQPGALDKGQVSHEHSPGLQLPVRPPSTQEGFVSHHPARGPGIGSQHLPVRRTRSR